MIDLTRSQLAQQLRDRRTPADQIRQALAVINAINSLMGGVGGSSWTHGQVVRHHRKWIIENAGEPVYHGMRPATLPEGRCRWCIARLHARTHDQPLPEASDLNRILLGRMCRNCAKAKVSAVVAHANYTTKRVNLGRTVEALLASAGAQVAARDSKGRVTRIKVREPGYRYESRADERKQKLATAAVPRGGRVVPASIHSCDACDRDHSNTMTPLARHLAEGRRLFGDLS